MERLPALHRLEVKARETYDADFADYDKGRQLWKLRKDAADTRFKLLRSPDVLHPALESHFAKYRKLVPALALINHLADVGHGLVGKAAMLRALGLVNYLETHARRAYGAGPEAETAAAKAIITHIRKGDLIDGFSAREVHQRGWSNLSDRSRVQAGLDLLCDLRLGCRGGQTTAHRRTPLNPLPDQP